jgi:hypothetical protein
VWTRYSCVVSKSVRPEPANRRGSPEAVAKRRAARAFNDLLAPESRSRLDGRTEQRRKRLLAELEAGKHRGSGKELKPIDVLSRVDELLAMGESVASLKKICAARPAPPPGDRLVDLVTELHQAYGFQPESYRFVGISSEVLRRAGVLAPAASAGRRKVAPHKSRAARRKR